MFAIIDKFNKIIFKGDELDCQLFLESYDDHKDNLNIICIE